MCTFVRQKNVFHSFKKLIEEEHKGIAGAFESAYKKTDDDYLEHCRNMKNPTNFLFTGTCAVSVYVDTTAGTVTCANLGDSRAIMGVLDVDATVLRTVELSSDHSASIKSEQDRIRSEHPNDPNVLSDMAAGYAGEEPDWMVKRTCAFTRSIGDFQMKARDNA